MYVDEVPILAAHGLASPEGFADLCTFALVSIRMNFARVPELVRDVRKTGEDSLALWGFKLDGYRAAHADAGKQAWWICSTTSEPCEAIRATMAIPGLGIAKAGFVCQMLGFDCACLDSRNMARLGLPRRAWRVDNDYSDKIMLRKIRRYCRLTRGRASELWDAWCIEVARDNGERPSDVSAWHLTAIADRVARTAPRVGLQEMPF